jgi:hypothetical protein
MAVKCLRVLFAGTASNVNGKGGKEERRTMISAENNFRGSPPAVASSLPVCQQELVPAREFSHNQQ